MRIATHRPPHCLARRRAVLLERIHRRYQTLTEVVTVGHLTMPFTRIADPNRVLDEVAAEEDRRDKIFGGRRPADQLHLPYWAELWDSSWGIAQWLVRQLSGSGEDCRIVHRSHAPFTRLRVLDLGCGMGFVGMVAAHLGAQVYFADLEAPALLFARLNSLSHASRTSTHCLNWQTARLKKRFDLIIGCDILYERSQWEFLEPFWRFHLAAGGQVVLGEPGRQTGDWFGTWIESRHWFIDRFEEAVAARTKPIRLFALRPRDH